MSELFISGLARSWFLHARYFYATQPWALSTEPISLSDSFEKIKTSHEFKTENHMNKVTLHSTVTLWDLQENQICDLTLVTPPESKPEKGRISFLSLLGSRLMGKASGDLVSVSFLGTAMRFRVIKIH